MNCVVKTCAIAFAAMFVLTTGQAVAIEEWPAPVPGFVAPVAGEHPRLLFRKGDVAALRLKAETPVGKAMVARLKYLLGGGEAMPAEFNPNPPLNIGAKGPQMLKPGAFTVNHAAGFGLLYQLTGEMKYADLARQCLDKVLAGQVDRDERYSWKAPGTGFRLSGVHQGVALAYDLCYEAWPDDYRQSVVKEIQTNAPKGLTLEALSTGNKYPASSNHYGAYVAGSGFAALAIRGDAGADNVRMDKILNTVAKSMKTLYTNGFGDGGWFGEGSGSDKTAVFPGEAGLMIALRTATGVDWCEGAPNARMAILTRALELVPAADAVRRPARGHYASGTTFWGGGTRDNFRDHGGWSSDGLFAIGIGALPERYRPGMSWIYDNFVEPDMKPEERIYEARIDPLEGVYALVNWPIDIPAENPATVFPLAVQDTLHGYVLARNGFKDSNDILFTGLARRGPTGYHKELAPQTVIIWGMGLHANLGALKRGPTTHWLASDDGSVCFTIGGTPWAVDYSRAAGCEGVIVCAGKVGLNVELPGWSYKPGEKIKAVTVKMGGVDYTIVTLSSTGTHPEVKVDGDKITIGTQTITCGGKVITLGTFTPAK